MARMGHRSAVKNEFLCGRLKQKTKGLNKIKIKTKLKPKTTVDTLIDPEMVLVLILVLILLWPFIIWVHNLLRNGSLRRAASLNYVVVLSEDRNVKFVTRASRYGQNWRRTFITLHPTARNGH